MNELYKADAESWKKQRVSVIHSAMTALEERYKELKRVLRKQLDGAADEGTDDATA